jgi:hypothetical protein
MQFKCIFTALYIYRANVFLRKLGEGGGELLILFLSFSALASAADFWRSHLHAPRRGFKCIRKRENEEAPAAAYPPAPSQHTQKARVELSWLCKRERDDFVKDWVHIYSERGVTRWRCLHRRKSASLWNWKLVCVNKVFLCKYYVCERAGDDCDKGCAIS